MIISITESQFNRIFDHKTVTCDKCGWEWKLSDGGDDPYTCHKCGHTNKEQEVDERSRSFANTRKKRLFPKSAMKSNPDRFKEFDKQVKGINEKIEVFGLDDRQVKSIEDLNKDAKFITCPNCRKKFTQTTHKKKKSLPICPNCGTHVQQKKED